MADHESTDLESAARLARYEIPPEPPEHPTREELHLDELKWRRDQRKTPDDPRDVY